MRFLMVASMVCVPYIVELRLTAPSFFIRKARTSHLLSLNITSNTTSVTTPRYPSYEVFDIPEAALSLHLTMLIPLDHLAMHSCLLTASLWVDYQKQNVNMPTSDFEWKDPAGAVFYIRSLGQHLTWADLSNVLQGLKDALEGQDKYFTTSFTVEESSTGHFIAQGRLAKYKHPEPTMLPVPESTK